MKVPLEIFELDPSWAMLWGSWLEIFKRTLTQRSRRAGGWKIERKGTRGIRWGFPRGFSVGPEIGEVEGCVVGNLNGTKLGYVIRDFVGNSEIDPDSAI